MTIHEELTLVARAKRGERLAMNQLWEALTPKVYGYLVNVVRNKELAEDILQDTWLQAVKALPQFEARGVRFSAWLFAIARNACRQHWRRSRPESPLETHTEDLETTNDKTAIEDYVFVDRILSRLADDDREILRLRYIGELSFNEIAIVLHISSVTARVRLHRALHRARSICNSTI